MTVQKQVSSIRSKVLPELLQGRTDVERALLNAADIIQQQNEILARSADEQNSSLVFIQDQTTKTNGRVNKHDQQIEEHTEILDAYKRGAARRNKMLLATLPFLVPIGGKIIDWLTTHLHF